MCIVCCIRPEGATETLRLNFGSVNGQPSLAGIDSLALLSFGSFVSPKREDPSRGGPSSLVGAYYSFCRNTKKDLWESGSHKAQTQESNWETRSASQHLLEPEFSALHFATTFRFAIGVAQNSWVDR